jgi:hypothetical protein
MYSIEYVKADRWQVVDGNDQSVFVGSKQQVENWLDLQENLRCRSSPQMSLVTLLHLPDAVASSPGEPTRPARRFSNWTHRDPSARHEALIP